MLECRQLCKQGALNDAKILSTSIDNLIQNEYLFPTNNTKFYQQNSPLYEAFQRSVKQLRSDISQTHHSLWNDGVDRTTKNQLQLNLTCLDQLFQCIFYEDKGEKMLMEKNIQIFATYCLQIFIQVLVEQNRKFLIDEQSTMITIRMEENDETKDNTIEQFNDILVNLKKFFDVLNTHLLSRVMNVQPSNDK